MKCPACNGAGVFFFQHGDADDVCEVCDGSGELCDHCKEPMKGPFSSLIVLIDGMKCDAALCDLCKEVTNGLSIPTPWPDW